MKKPESFEVGIERGAQGYSAAWCLDLPGAYALVPPDADPVERMRMAILEFAAWAHNRQAERLAVARGDIEVVQVLETGEDVRAGDTSAFFLFDGSPSGVREFPAWANAHDQALDELCDLVGTLPPALLEAEIEGGRSLRDMAIHAAEAERWHAAQLVPSVPAGKGGTEIVRQLRDAHTVLQQVVCDVPVNLRVRRPTSKLHESEEWSVRKVMRRSIWHLRYHTWEMRRAISGAWLG